MLQMVGEIAAKGFNSLPPEMSPANNFLSLVVS